MKESNNIEHTDWGLLAKYVCNETSESESQKVETWADESVENLAILKESRVLMDKAKRWFENESFDPETAWAKVLKQIETSSPVIPITAKTSKEILFSRILRIAAVIFLAVSLSVAGYYIGFRQQKHAIFTEIITNGQQIVSGITLPDGSVVTLNRNSKLSYPKEFSGSVREVTITGEAFFEVEPDASRPFVIDAGNARIKVLGTSFNVCAYPGEETVDVLVETGKVEVSCHSRAVSSDCNVVLVPGEKGVLSNREFTLRKSVNTDRNITSWKTRRFVFDQTPLSEVVNALEKVYFVNIQLVDPGMNNLTLTANFNNQPIDFILDVVSLTFNLELKAMNGQYFLTTGNNNLKP